LAGIAPDGAAVFSHSEGRSFPRFSSRDHRAYASI
jgi:hypothetical protein